MYWTPSAPLLSTLTLNIFSLPCIFNFSLWPDPSLLSTNVLKHLPLKPLRIVYSLSPFFHWYIFWKNSLRLQPPPPFLYLLLPNFCLTSTAITLQLCFPNFFMSWQPKKINIFIWHPEDSNQGHSNPSWHVRNLSGLFFSSRAMFMAHQPTLAYRVGSSAPQKLLWQRTHQWLHWQMQCLLLCPCPFYSRVYWSRAFFTSNDHSFFNIMCNWQPGSMRREEQATFLSLSAWLKPSCLRELCHQRAMPGLQGQSTWPEKVICYSQRTPES